MVHIETKYLQQRVENLDHLYDSNSITTAEYMQIGLLLKIFEALDKKR